MCQCFCENVYVDTRYVEIRLSAIGTRQPSQVDTYVHSVCRIYFIDVSSRNFYNYSYLQCYTSTHQALNFREPKNEPLPRIVEVNWKATSKSARKRVTVTVPVPVPAALIGVYVYLYIRSIFIFCDRVRKE